MNMKMIILGYTQVKAVDMGSNTVVMTIATFEKNQRPR